MSERLVSVELVKRGPTKVHADGTLTEFYSIEIPESGLNFGQFILTGSEFNLIRAIHSLLDAYRAANRIDNQRMFSKCGDALRSFEL